MQTILILKNHCMKKFYLLSTLVLFSLFSMKAQNETPANLHVSPTGWAQWESDADIEQPEYGETFSYAFDLSLAGWTLIDGNNDGRTWQVGFDPFGGVGAYCATSMSSDGYTAFNVNDFLVSQQVMIGQKSVLTYEITSHWSSPRDHYGIAISTASPTNPDDFTVIFDEVAPYGWTTKTIDLGAYAGRYVYIAFRHYNANGFKLDLKNVVLGNSAKRGFVGFNIKLDDELVAQNVANCYYQHDTDGLVEGQTYTTSVQAVFTEGPSEWATYEWVYSACDNYEGYESVNVENLGNKFRVSWDAGETPEGTYLYYDDGTNEEGIGLMAGTPIYWAIYIPAETLDSYLNYRATKVAMFDYEGHRGKIMIYQGDETTPENLLYTQDYTTTGCGHYIDIPFDEYVAVDNKRALWFVMFSITGDYPAPIGPNTGDYRGRLYSDNGIDWYDLANNGIDNSFNLRGYIEENDGVLGTMVFKNEVCLTPKPVHGDNFVDEGAKEQYEYCIRKVYSSDANDPERFAMSCPVCATITDVAETEDNLIGIYPNPASETVTIQGIEVENIKIYNLFGQLVETLESTQIVNVKDYTSGVYTMVINGNEKIRFVVK